jgi:hypothetical protein
MENADRSSLKKGHHVSANQKRGHITSEKRASCVREPEARTHPPRKTGIMCPEKESADTSPLKIGHHVFSNGKREHITLENWASCVRERKVRTHPPRKTGIMCPQKKNADTSTRKKCPEGNTISSFVTMINEKTQ